MESQDLIKTIGGRLKAARLALTDKQSLEIAKTLCVAPSTYSQHENGKRAPSLEMLMKYSAYYKISPAWLLTGNANITEPYCKTSEEKIRKQLFILDLEDHSLLTPIHSIGNNLVNLELLLEVFMQLMQKFSMLNNHLSQKELTNFCLDIYNSLVNVDTSINNKKNMILLSIDSLNTGLQKSEINKAG